jgi:hypothetical protein
MPRQEKMMPNFVTTRCTVHGLPGEVDAFWDQVTGRDDDGRLQMDFEKVLPLPVDASTFDQGGKVVDLFSMSGSSGPTGGGTWDEWRMKNWGTKWNASGLLVVSDDPLEFSFGTALGFPLQVFQALACKFPTLTFEFVAFEESWWFAVKGCFNAGCGRAEYERCEATAELYDEVYGSG